MPASSPRSAEPAAVATAFLAAYGKKDFDSLADLFDEGVELVHYKRAIAHSGKDAVVAMFRASGDPEGTFPDRRFAPPRRLLCQDDLALIEHTWEATAREDVPAMECRAGETVKLDLMTILTVRDGRIVKYEEYG
jgi:ketosteroid isomerase-like protein